MGHSASANMGTIDQVGPSKGRGSRADKITATSYNSGFDRYIIQYNTCICNVLLSVCQLNCMLRNIVYEFQYQTGLLMMLL